MKVIRVICYEGDEESVRNAIQKSKSLGIHNCNGYIMTIGEHINELPELVELSDTEVCSALEGD